MGPARHYPLLAYHWGRAAAAPDAEAGLVLRRPVSAAERTSPRAVERSNVTGAQADLQERQPPPILRQGGGIDATRPWGSRRRRPHSDDEWILKARNKCALIA